jgi:hypothetical protein
LWQWLFSPSLSDISSTEKIWRKKSKPPPEISCCWYSFFCQRYQMSKKKNSQSWRVGLQKCSKNSEAISKFWATNGSNKPRSKLRTHKSQWEGATVRNLAARNFCTPGKGRYVQKRVMSNTNLKITV